MQRTVQGKKGVTDVGNIFMLIWYLACSLPLRAEHRHSYHFFPFRQASKLSVHTNSCSILDEKSGDRSAFKMGTKSQVGNMYSHKKKDVSICTLIAEDGYDENLGIRSLFAVVRDEAMVPVFWAILDVDKDIEEGEEMSDCVLDVRGGEISATLISPNLKEV